MNDPSSSFLFVEVYDHDNIGKGEKKRLFFLLFSSFLKQKKDDFIGSVKIPIERLKNQLLHEKIHGSWFKLGGNGKQKVAGFVHITADLTSESAKYSLLSSYGSLCSPLPFRLDYGDILLFNSRNIASNLISAVTMSSWDHAGVVVLIGSSWKLLESTGSGVYAYNLTKRITGAYKHSA